MFGQKGFFDVVSGLMSAVEVVMVNAVEIMEEVVVGFVVSMVKHGFD